MRHRESLEQLKQYPVFQHWRAKAETHQLQFRPAESARLKAQGIFDEVIDSRTESLWNAMVGAKAAGAEQHEAEELTLDIILLPLETEYECEGNSGNDIWRRGT
jgi:hypothetical protein